MLAALVIVVVFLAALVQTIAGFGFALMVMPLLVLTLGIQTAAPLVALTGCTLYALNLSRHRQSINLAETLRLMSAALLGIPLGVLAIRHLDGHVVQVGLGVLLICYALYAMAKPTARAAISSRWGYPAGFLAGCLGGAYNTAGPPVIVYGDMQQWARDEFRSVLQALFLFNALFVIAAHAMVGNLTASVGHYYLLAAPALLLGIAVGARLDRHVTAARFRMVVNGMVLLLGVSLLF